MNSPRELSKGGIYFTIVYCDEDMKYPCVSAYVYIGTGLPGRAAGKHFFQTTDSYCEAGNWAAMSDEERRRLGPEAVISCVEEDISLMKSTNELIEELTEFRRRWGAGS